jgi:hypothetical protein
MSCNWLKIYPKDVMDGVYSTILYGMVRKGVNKLL